MGEQSRRETSSKEAAEVLTTDALRALELRDYLDQRVRREIRRHGTNMLVVAGVCTVFLALLGYLSLPGFLAERLRKQVDDYFRERGSAQLERNIQEAKANLEEAEKTLSSLKEQEQALEELNALRRLGELEHIMERMRNEGDMLRYGNESVAKGSEFSIAVGPTVTKWRVRDIKMGGGRASVALRGPELYNLVDLTLTANYSVDEDGRPHFEPGAKQALAQQNHSVEFSIFDISGDRVWLLYRIIPGDPWLFRPFFGEPARGGKPPATAADTRVNEK